MDQVDHGEVDHFQDMRGMLKDVLLLGSVLEAFEHHLVLPEQLYHRCQLKESFNIYKLQFSINIWE